MEQGRGVIIDRDDKALEPKHKIFLSHSGAQKDFVEQLCLDVEACDRYPFFDIRRNSLPIGINFPSKIFEAIRQCQVGVLILSEEFFSRTKWPMLELVAMVNSKKVNTNLIIMPVFLGITREECCKIDNHRRWLSKWQEWARTSNSNHKIDTNEWVDALKLFGSTNGISYCEVLGEVKCRKEIVDAICEQVLPETRWDDFHVQGKARLCKVIHQHFQRTSVSSIYKARVVGLYGVGGIGKTTACKVLCNYLFKEFQGKVCHIELENGSDSSELEFLNLLHTMLKRFTNIKHEILMEFDIGECTTLLRKVIRKEKIFVAIDNLYDSTKIIDQAKTLLNFDYAEGSIVLITARSYDLLQILKVIERDCIEMPELNEDEAKLLFFHQITMPSKDGYDEFVKSCIERCSFRKGDGNNYHYHPLALKVLSIQLGNDPYEWTEQLMKLDTFNQFCEKKHPIFSILRKSFDDLSKEDQDLFMDIALFFPEDINHESWTNIFEWLSMVHRKSITHIKEKLNNLKRKSLLENIGDGSKKINTHDLWYEFCIIETTRGELELRRFLYEEYDFQFKFEESNLFYGGWENLSRICLRVRDNEDVMVKEIDLNKCSKLIVLKLVGLNLKDTLLDLSNLKFLKCLEICQGSMPISINGLGLLKHLVVLRLDPLSTESQFIQEIGYLTKLQVLYLNSHKGKDKLLNIGRLTSLQEVTLHEFWNGIDTASLGLSSKMTQIQTLNLVKCLSLQSSQGLNDLVTLKHFCIELCPKLEDIHNFQQLQMLQNLTIYDCNMIKALPGIGNLTQLEKLKICSCAKIIEITDLQKLKKLQVLYVEECKSLKALSGVGDLTALTDLRLKDCENLLAISNLQKIEKLQILFIEGCNLIKSVIGISASIFLEELQFKSCENLGDIPNLYKLKKLRLLYIEDCKSIKMLPSFEDLLALEEIEVKSCEYLMEIPSLENLQKLQILSIENCKAITSLFGLDNLTSLEDLKLNGCENLVEVPNLQRLNSLRQFYMEGCESITTLFGLGELVALEDLRLNACKGLKEIPNLQRLECLQILQIEDCKSITTLLGLDALINLEDLRLNGCENLLEVPDLQKLQRLQLLYMEGCKSITTLHGLGNLISLEDLRLNACGNLIEVPNLQKLHNLQILYMEDCKSITTISGLGALIILEDLRLNGCENLVEVHDLQMLQRLQLLYMEGCKSITTLHGLGNLINLEHLKMIGCKNLLEVYNLQELKRLQTLSIKGCKLIKTLPGLEDLISLEQLILNSCENLIEAPNFKKLKRLHLLNLDGCKSIKVLSGLSNLTALNDLRINNCISLPEVLNVQKLESLRILYMEGCKSIKALVGLEDLEALEQLKVDECENLTHILGIQKLKSLKFLSIAGCKSISNLLDLAKNLPKGCILRSWKYDYGKNYVYEFTCALRQVHLKPWIPCDPLKALPLELVSKSAQLNIYEEEQPHSISSQLSFVNIENKAQHGGVYCNLCNKLPIVGPRYTSKKLYDFDLCGDCFQQWGIIEDYSRIDSLCLSNPLHVLEDDLK